MKIRKYFEQNKNAAYQSKWDATKAVLQVEYVVPDLHIGKKRLQISDLTFQLKKLEKRYTN